MVDIAAVGIVAFGVGLGALLYQSRRSQRELDNTVLRCDAELTDAQERIGRLIAELQRLSREAEALRAQIKRLDVAIMSRDEEIAQLRARPTSFSEKAKKQPRDGLGQFVKPEQALAQ